jgi:hypothetical protein
VVGISTFRKLPVVESKSRDDFFSRIIFLKLPKSWYIFVRSISNRFDTRKLDRCTDTPKTFVLQSVDVDSMGTTGESVVLQTTYFRYFQSTSTPPTEVWRCCSMFFFRIFRCWNRNEFGGSTNNLRFSILPSTLTPPRLVVDVVIKTHSDSFRKAQSAINRHSCYPGHFLPRTRVTILAYADSATIPFLQSLETNTWLLGVAAAAWKLSLVEALWWRCWRIDGECWFSQNLNIHESRRVELLFLVGKNL